MRIFTSQFSFNDKIFFRSLLLVSTFLAIFFRIYNLWLADFQGDEVVSHAFLFLDKPFLDFLLTELKGPGQYLIANFTYNLFGSAYYYELFARLPTVIAALGSLFFIYKTTKESYGYKIATLAIFFAGLSGHLTGYSRAAFYQGFIMLTATSSIYFITKYIINPNKKIHIPILTGILSGIGLLFHYNALSYILPITLIFFFYKHFKVLFIYVISVFTIASIFYIPYILNPSFSQTFNYLYYDRISANFYYDSIFY